MTNKPDQTFKLQAVLFDLDGTLLDTANDLGEALNHVLQQNGLPVIDEEIYRPQASNGAKGLLELGFGSKIKEFDYESLRAEFLAHYEENIARHTRLYDGIDSLLTSLNSNNIPWGIITNKPEALTLLLLPNYPQFEQCQCIVGGDTLPKRKPDPAPLLHACELMSVTAENCIYVGDAQRDIEAGNNANMKTVIAQWGYIFDLKETNNWQADYSTKTPEALKELIKIIY